MMFLGLGGAPTLLGRSMSRVGLLGLGDGGYTENTPCDDIPIGDPYRVPQNYCTQPSGNMIQFNGDGSVDPDPFAAAAGGGTKTPASSPWYSAALTALAQGFTQGITKPASPGAGVIKPMVPAVPWYKTPIGMIGIAIGIGGIYLVARK